MVNGWAAPSRLLPTHEWVEPTSISEFNLIGLSEHTHEQQLMSFGLFLASRMSAEIAMHFPSEPSVDSKAL